MVKRIGIMITALICLLALAGCSCEHVWADATCEVPRTCTKCGATEGEKAEHQWIDATCEKPKTCTVCGAFSGFSAGHQLDDTTCTIVCTVCGYVDPASVEHEWVGPFCAAPKICVNCETKEGEPLGHSWSEGSCLEPRQCSVCFEIDEGASDHAWVDDGCVKRCETCNMVDFSTNPHTLGADSDGISGSCTVCGKKIAYFISGDQLYAVTEYPASDDPAEIVTYIRSKHDGTAVAVAWFEDGTLSDYSTDTFVGGIDASAFYVNGEVYYYAKYDSADEETIIALMNAAARYISFSSAIYDELDYASATLVGPGGFEGESRGEVHAAVDAYGNQFCIAHRFSESSDATANVWAIPCNWMK